MEKPKFIIYCQVEFLETLYDKIDKPLSELLEQSIDIEMINYYHQLVNLIHKQSMVVIDLNDEMLDKVIENKSEDYNPILTSLLKDEKFDFFNDSSAFEQIEHNSFNFPHALYFLSKTPSECKNLCENHGFIFISKDEIDEKIQFLFNFDIQNIVHNQQPNGWHFLERYGHSFNSMIIADNYILNRRYDENLFALMRNLMPQTLNNQDFHLTIIVKDDSTVSENQRQRINDFLESEFNYTINLTILKSSRLHDRNILTNYIWISSAYGFELFNNGNVLENRQTQVTMFPMTYLKPDFKSFFDINNQSDLKNTILETFDYLVNQSREINNNTINIPPHTINVYGDKTNRLLE